MEIKTFDWYIANALRKLEKSNFIPPFELDYDTKLGLYYIMEIYGLSFIHWCHGSWEFIILVKDEDNKNDGLKANDILALPINMERYNELARKHAIGQLPATAVETSPKKDNQPFGWLSPTGDFIESTWGEHETSAERIVHDKKMSAEYGAWLDSDDSTFLAGDFLCMVKGYVLIHNPSNDGGYVVTNTKPLTKKQKEFLYSYFADIGNIGRANFYINDELGVAR